MPNPRLAGRYAKSLVDLAIERNTLEEVYKDMLFLQKVCKSNPDFVALLKSPVVKPDKKAAILDAVTGSEITELTASFNRLLVNKGRESNLPEIIIAFVEQYKLHKGIQTVRLTTAIPVSDELKDQITALVQQQAGTKKIDLTTAVQEDILGGFKLEIGDTLIDASISYDLNKIKSQFLNNDFIYKIR